MLLDEEMRLVGKIISRDGTVFEQRRYGPFLDVELDAACYAFFKGEHLMFGGMTKKRQIAKIDGCAIEDTGVQLGYSFDSYHGKCVVIENNIGFEDDSKENVTAINPLILSDELLLRFIEQKLF